MQGLKGPPQGTSGPHRPSRRASSAEGVPGDPSVESFLVGPRASAESLVLAEVEQFLEQERLEMWERLLSLAEEFLASREEKLQQEIDRRGRPCSQPPTRALQDVRSLEKRASSALSDICGEGVSDPVILDDSGYLGFFYRVVEHLEASAEKALALAEEKIGDLFG
ncbi:hypothetical protein D1007_14904 [Hordeum vulgare]|nr:hypothetical protein D1007_14904 [Hordeum vulgare]